MGVRVAGAATVGGKFTPESSHSHCYPKGEEKETAGRAPSLALEALLLAERSRRISTGELQTLHYAQR